MENIRNGNLSVTKMKKEIEQSMISLQLGYLHKRARRQLTDGAKFLNMIELPMYKSCLTVSSLKKKISEERERLKQQLLELDESMPGHQMTFFEVVKEVTTAEQTIKSKQIANLEFEVRWLHKCLGICSNRLYFK